MTVMPEPVDEESRTRTHLANERTFLAWFRTGITLIALGLAAAQFLTVERDGIPIVHVLATLLVIGGIVLALVGAARYVAGRDRIEAMAFRPASWSILVTTAGAVVVGLIAIALVWLLRPV